VIVARARAQQRHLVRSQAAAPLLLGLAVAPRRIVIMARMRVTSCVAVVAVAAIFAPSTSVAADPVFTDVITYRLWPKTGKGAATGLTNVDSGDAKGDTLFGLSNLLLPQLCAVKPTFLW
jgi:hypothetical protein